MILCSPLRKSSTRSIVCRVHQKSIGIDWPSRSSPASVSSLHLLIAPPPEIPFRLSSELLALETETETKTQVRHLDFVARTSFETFFPSQASATSRANYSRLGVQGSRGTIGISLRLIPTPDNVLPELSSEMVLRSACFSKPDKSKPV